MSAHSVDSANAKGRLFILLATGAPVSECGGLLGEVGDVDGRDTRRRTLLHWAVRSGKADWVERLLRMGADPCLCEAEGGGALDALRLAEDMCTAHPDDASRREVLRMVRLVHEWDAARCLRGGRGAPGGDTPSKEEESLDRISSDVSSLRSEFSYLRKKMDAMHVGSKSRDGSLERSGVEGQHLPLKGEVQELKKRVEDGFQGLNSSVAIILDQLNRASEERARSECVDAMMLLTTILDVDEGKTSLVRSFYSRIHSASPLTSWLLTFFRSQSWFKVVVDCDSSGIGRMKGRFRDHDQVKKNGMFHRSFADLEEMRVYLGGELSEDWNVERVAGRLSMSLCQVAMILAFSNEGRPYAKGDEGRGRQYRALLEEVKVKEKKGSDTPFSYVLLQRSQMAQEIYLLPAVPAIIVQLGSRDGLSTIRGILPGLIDYYEQNVMARLPR